MKNWFTPFFTPYDARKGKRVYVSGPMTGYPDMNYPAFDGASDRLRTLGYAVCNPCETTDILGSQLEHSQYLRFDFERVLEADFLVALPGWEQSLGAISEILVAVRIGTKVWRWDTFEDYDRVTYADVQAAIAAMQNGVAPTTIGAAS